MNTQKNKKMSRKAIYILSLAVLLLGAWLLINAFKKDNLSPKEFVSWVNKGSGALKANKEIGDFKFSLLYKPHAYMVINENKGLIMSKDLLEKGKKEYEGMQYYTFRIESKSSKSELLKVNLQRDEEYYERLQYYSGDMENDISLVDGQDTLPCLLFHFERDYGLTPYAQFVLGFDEKNTTEKKATNNKEFIYNDRIFGSGIIHLLIEGKNIDKIPSIKF